MTFCQSAIVWKVYKNLTQDPCNYRTTWGKNTLSMEKKNIIYEHDKYTQGPINIVCYPKTHKM